MTDDGEFVVRAEPKKVVHLDLYRAKDSFADNWLTKSDNFEDWVDSKCVFIPSRQLHNNPTAALREMLVSNTRHYYPVPRGADVKPHTYVGNERRYAEHVLVDRDDIAQMSGILDKIDRQLVVDATRAPTEVDEGQPKMAMTVSEIGFFVFALFGFLVIISYSLEVQFIHPAIGLVATVSGVIFILMGWSSRHRRDDA